ncbi:hypothetical protein GCM10009021_07600 [Halarchaeum nitratireducens]|uniref:Uncharacterized protein n=1 Tax=Halarchaeum nitratireducens TaxID=489913 RepID=A0A830G937_9EURY|nr:hypothetical protein GCM10009021_07600 [Halarchaeum nitratireducens]
MAGLAAIDPILAIVVLTFEGLLIYYRGYLIPGTPELTKRYMPAWMLKLFGKTPVEERLLTHTQHEEPAIDADQLDPIVVLAEAGVATETADGTDVTLTSSFQNRLNQQEFAAPTEDAEEIFTELFDSVTIEDTDASIHHLTRSGGRVILTWPSHAAMLGDAKIAQALAETDTQFTERDEMNQLQLVQSTRTLLETCPACNGSLSFSQEERETCCQTYTAGVLSCDACDSTFLEVNESALDDAATA